jgi:hypothetical protein
MSIKSDVEELNKLGVEIKSLSTQIRFLRQQSAEVEGRILNFLREKEQPGVKYKGTAVLIENKQKRAPKKSKDREIDALGVLERHGISNPQEVYDQIMEARKGEEVDTPKIKIKKLP